MPNPPKPIESLKREGTYRPDRHAGKGIEVAPADLKAPSHLDRVQKKAWRELYESVKNAGIPLSEADAPAVEAAAVALTRARAADKIIAEQGRYQGEPGRLKRHPAAVEQTEAWKTYKEWANALGLTPSARAGMASPPKKAEADPFADAVADFFKRSGS